LTGVGAAHRQANHGLADGVEMTTVNPSDLEKLPAYEAHERDPDAAPLLMSDAMMNDGLHPSIEDEGIVMDNGYEDMNYNNLNTHSRGITAFTTWNFDNINDLGSNSRGNQMVSGTGSDADDASDIVQHDSSADESSIRGRINDFENAIPETDDGIPFEDPSPVPDMDELGQASAIALQADLLEKIQNGDSIYPRPEFEVTGQDERLEVEEPATEIHLDPNDELKLD
jgi:ubiquitin carboxyl-terminal hydrolase 4/11/15